MNKKRINITIDDIVHQKSKFWSKKEGKSLSEKIEDLLINYNKTKIASEPLPTYNSVNSIATEVTTVLEKLPLQKQIQVLEFTQFLIHKNASQSTPSLWGLLKGQIFLSDDFDAPLDEFKEYTQ